MIQFGEFMEETEMIAPQINDTPTTAPASTRQTTIKTWAIVVVGILILSLVVGVVILLMSAGSDNVGKIRDIFIIFMALESLLIGAVLIILVVQLAILTNLIQNEIKPILDSTNETVNTLKGTTVFISKNVTEPIITLNTYLAGLKKFFEVVFPSKK